MLNLLASLEDPHVGISKSYELPHLRPATTSTILFATVLAAMAVCYSKYSYALVSTRERKSDNNPTRETE